MDDIDFSLDNYKDIIGNDNRYDARAYSFLQCVMLQASDNWKRHISAGEILEEFKCLALDQYGPLAYRVLTEWGVTSTDDIGEMMANLIKSGRIKANEGDSQSDFCDRFNFEEEFLGPFLA